MAKEKKTRRVAGYTYEWIKTTHDGKKVAISSELVARPEIKEQMRVLRLKLQQHRPDLIGRGSAG